MSDRMLPGLTTADRGPRFREFMAVGAVLTTIVAADLVLSRCWGLLTQTPWLDECLTLLVLNDPSFAHGLAAIRGGVENTPPAFFMVVWPFARLLGHVTPLELRVLNCIFVLLACLAVYGSCRLFVERERAAIGAFIVAINPAVVVQLFQVRFYAFWLAGTAWLVYATLRHAREPDRRSLFYARCVLAAVVVASHWFGIIGLILVTAGDFRVRRAEGNRRDLVVPPLAGLLMLVLCAPLLASQRGGLSVATWIDPFTWKELVTQARTIFGGLPMAFLIAFAAYRVVGKVGFRAEKPTVTATLPALALLFFPVALIALSLVLQPVFRSKYMIPAVIPIGMLAALLIPPPTAKWGKSLIVVVAAALLFTGAVELRQLRVISRADVAALDRSVSVADSLSAMSSGEPVVFLRRFEQHPVLQRRPQLAATTALIDFDGTARLPDFWLFERDMARRVNRVYPQYRLMTVPDLGRLREFLVIARPEDESILHILFPEHDVSSRSARVYAVARR
jgi:hypothetical protein